MGPDQFYVIKPGEHGILNAEFQMPARMGAALLINHCGLH
jgi:hypothetical protein